MINVQAIRDIKVLSALKDSELQMLLGHGIQYKFEAHSNIVIEGELSWGLYLILTGTVRVFKTNKLTGDIYEVGELNPGTVFGEMSLIDENPRSATVRATTDVTVFFISKDVFKQLLQSSPDLKLRLYESWIRLIVNRLRELDDNYVVSQYQLWKTALKKKEAA